METNFAALICFLPALIIAVQVTVAHMRYAGAQSAEATGQKPIEAKMPTPEEEAMMPDYMPEPREPFPLLLMRLGLEMVIVTENENEE